jgi:hypothetical protein
MVPACGDGVCAAGESDNCPRDCCGDGTCTRYERFYCVPDCGTTCGDMLCQITDLFLCSEECGGDLPLPAGAPGTPLPLP